MGIGLVFLKGGVIRGCVCARLLGCMRPFNWSDWPQQQRCKFVCFRRPPNPGAVQLDSAKTDNCAHKHTAHARDAPCELSMLRMVFETHAAL